MRFVSDLANEGKPFHHYSAIGLEDVDLVGGVVYEFCTGTNIFAHIASDGSRKWISPAFLGAIFWYPFEQLKCNRITVFVRVDNVDSQRFVEHLGFKREGQLRAACTDGSDLIIYGMLKSECRYIEGKYHAAFLADIGRS